MNVLLLTSHAIAEHDDLEMFVRMGVDIYSIGGAYDETPFEGKRPAVTAAPLYLDLIDATNRQRERMAAAHGDPGPAIDWAKARLAPEVIAWADTIIVHHFPEQWIGGNWPAIRDKRVVWRTCGQSDPRLELAMARYVRDGLQVVRYSPKEGEAFGAWGVFAGQDALIRFGKDPEVWTGWNGRTAAVANITQHMRQRGDACGYAFWEAATAGLPTIPAGPGSEEMGGLGPITYDRMRAYLQDMRVYLYTGTRPASYTLGLIEAMMTGIPVVSIGPAAFEPSELFEAHEIAGGSSHYANSPTDARFDLETLLAESEMAAAWSADMRRRAIDLFGIDKIMGQWADFLGLDPEERP